VPHLCLLVFYGISLKASPLERKELAGPERFMERLGQPDRANEFEGLSVNEYAEHKGLRLSNPLENAKGERP